MSPGSNGGPPESCRGPGAGGGRGDMRGVVGEEGLEPSRRSRGTGS